MDKPGGWFVLAKCLKNTCGREVQDLHLYLKCHSSTRVFQTFPQVSFKHFGSKNQLPGFYIRGTLVENRLTIMNANRKQVIII